MRFLNQSQGKVKQNQRKRENTFDIQLKLRPLYFEQQSINGLYLSFKLCKIVELKKKMFLKTEINGGNIPTSKAILLKSDFSLYLITSQLCIMKYFNQIT